MKKRIFSWLLVMSMLVGMLPLSVMAVTEDDLVSQLLEEEVDLEDEAVAPISVNGNISAMTVVEAWGTGDGTSADTAYEIADATDLELLATNVNAGTSTYEGVYFKLVDDIELSGTWTPIGANTVDAYTYTYTFNGNFDGDEHTISGLSISGSTSSYFVGLFGAIQNATIKNLVIAGSVTSSSSNANLGGLVGSERGNSTISNIASTVTVSSSNAYCAGGIVGYLSGSGTMSNCYSLGAVSNNNNNVGGLVGYNNGTIDHCYATGNVSGTMYVGGLAGSNGGTIQNSVALNGSVAASNDNASSMVGRITGYISGSDGGSISNCYALETMSTTYSKGSSNATITDSTSGMHGGNIYVDLLTGLFIDEACTDAFSWTKDAGFGENWVIDETIVSTDYVLYDSDYKSYINLPILFNETVGTKTLATAPAGTEADPYRIESASDLVLMQEKIAAGNYNIATTYYVLSNNIDLKGDADNQWTPIGDNSNKFAANFDGQGYTISGLYIDSEDAYQGLFGYVTGTVKNLTVAGTVTSTGNYVGGIAGYNIGTIQYCVNEVTVNGGDYVGGIAGYQGTNNIYYNANYGAISGDDYVGGIVGYITGKAVGYSYNMGKISGTSYVGGLVGALAVNASVSRCYSTGDVEGTTYIGGIVGGVSDWNRSEIQYNVMLQGSVTGTSSVGRIVGGASDSEGAYTLTNNYGDVNSEVTGNPTTGAAYTGTENGTDLSHHVVYGLATEEEEVVSAFAWGTNVSFNTSYWSIPTKYVSDDETELYLPEILELYDGDYPSITLQAEADGSELVPYRISTQADLVALATSGETYEGKYFILTDDITLTGEWTPIGTSSTPFKGNFDGQDFAITDLYISVDYETSVNQGLFGYTDGATIKNLSVAGSVDGAENVGGIVGWANSTTISNVSSSVTVKGTDSVGGIVGKLENGSITNAYNTGSITAITGTAGGIVGLSTGDITSVYNTGAISSYMRAGGIVGYASSGSVSYALSLGSSISGDTEKTGRIAGDSNITPTYAYGFVGVGDKDGENGANIYYNYYYGLSTEKENGTAYDWSGFGAFNKSSIYVNDDHNTIYLPTLFEEAHPTIDMTVDGYADLTATNVEIYTEDDLISLANQLADGYSNHYEKTFTLMNNITLTKEWTTPIGGTDDKGDASDSKSFRGTFDGQGYTISGLNINNTDSTVDYQGLFGYVYGGTVKNLNVEGTVSSTGDYVGGIVGQAAPRYTSSSYIENCTFTGTVSGGQYVGGIAGSSGLNYTEHSGGYLRYCTNYGKVTGESYVGGIVGTNGYYVQYCYNKDDVTATGDSGVVGGIMGSNGSMGTSYLVNEGTISGTQKVGGIAGSTIGNLQYSYNLGDVTGSGNYVGGILGGDTGGSSTYTPSIRYNYNIGNISGADYVGGIMGASSYYDTVNYNVSLGDAITSTGSNVGRVIGYSDYTTTSNNYAYEGMTVNGQEVTGGTASNTSGADLYHNNTYGLSTDAEGEDEYAWSNFDTDIWEIPTTVGDATSTPKILYLPQLTYFYDEDEANFPTTTWYVYDVVSSLDLTSYVTAPVKNGTPSTGLATTNDEYTAAITWKDASGNAVTDKFLGGTVYTATVTLTAAEGYTFVGVEADRFKYTDATSITNTADSGTVTITFAATGAATLSSIAVKTEPTTTEYSYGDTFSTDGLVLTATYDDGTTDEITEGFTASTTPLTMGTTSITITYGEKTVDQDITVNKKVVDVTWTVGSDYTYTGSELTYPTAVIEDTDIAMTVTIETGKTFTNVGEYTFTTTLSTADAVNYVLAENATDTQDATITAKALESSMIGTIADQTYTGGELKPTPTITYNGMTLVAGTDFTYSYTNNITVSTNTATVTITAVEDGNYTDGETAASKTFTIVKDGSTTTTTTTATVVYGESIDLTANVTVGITTMAAGTSNYVDFYLEAGETDVLLGSAEVTYADNGSGSAILKYDTSDRALSIGNNTIYATYNGGVNLNGSNSGTITVALTAKPVTATVSTTTITKTYDGGTTATVAWAVASGDIVKTGDAITVTATATYDTANVGTGKAISFIGLATAGEQKEYYSVSLTENITGAITAKALESSMIGTIVDQTYTGGELKPTPTITYGDETLVAGEDFTYSYADNITVSEDTATVTITAVADSNYTDGDPKASKTFTIIEGESKVTPDVDDEDALDSYTYTYGEDIVLTAAVEIVARGASISAGTDEVTFTATGTNGEVELGTGTVTYASDGTGTATLTYKTTAKTIPVGTYTIKAYYGGGDNLKLNDSGENTITITLKAKTIDDVTVGTVAAKAYNGYAQTFTDIALTSDDVETDDTVTLTTSYTTTDADAANYTVSGIVALGEDDDEGYYVLAENADITFSGTVTIAPYDVSDDNVDDTATVIEGMVDFTEATFTGVTIEEVAETVTGTIAYTYDGGDYANYAALIAKLDTEVVATNGTEIIVTYIFTPSDSNYTGTITGTITLTVLKIVFDTTDGLTLETATYGDTLAEIFTFVEDNFSATVNETPVDGTYVLYVNGTEYDGTTILNADTAYTYEVKFTDNQEVHDYEDVVALEGTFNVAARVVTLDWTNHSPYTYDGTTTFAPTAEVSNLVGDDAVTVTVTGGSVVVVTDNTVEATDLSDTNYTLTTATGTTATYSVVAATATGSVTVSHTDTDVDGALNVGDVLTADISAVTPAGGTPSYQWYKVSGGETTEIGTDSERYTLGDSDTAGKIYVTVTFSGNTEGDFTSPSLDIAKYLLTGTATITETDGVLTVTAPTNTDIEDTDYTITWTGATTVTADSYTITNADKGETVTVTITATEDSEGFTGSITNSYAVATTAPVFTAISTSRGNGYVTITWTAEDGGSDLTGYSLSATYVVTTTTTDESTGETTTVETVTDVEGAPFTDIALDATSYTVSGLTNGTTYTFKLMATNGVGDTLSEEVTGTPYRSSSSSSSSTTTTTTDSDTTTNDDGSVTATVETTSTTSSGVTSTVVNDDVIDTAIETAVEEADGEDAHIEIAVDTKTSTDTVEVELSVDAVETIAQSDVESLRITSDLGTVSIPSEALDSMAGQASGTDITIIVSHVDSEELTEQQATIIGDGIVVDLTVLSGGTTISSFGGHEITVAIPYTLQDGEDAENIVVWYIADDGTITAMETIYNEETGMATFTTTHFSVFTVIHDTNVFEDVDPNAYYYDAVLWAVENGITAGTTDTTFDPAKICTRAQAVTFLWRAAGEPEATIDNPFSDVVEGAYYYDAVLWAVEMGITTGYEDGTFRPNTTCNRGAIVTFLYRFAGEPEVDGETEEIASDVAHGAYYYSAVLWAVENGITTGYSDGTFRPTTLCNRGQIVTFLYRAMGA